MSYLDRMKQITAAAQSAHPGSVVDLTYRPKSGHRALLVVDETSDDDFHDEQIEDSGWHPTPDRALDALEALLT